jgi:hypothetical protein
MAAINLEMPGRIPRTEYSAHFHWDLVNQVCGLSVHENSTPEEKQRASSAFIRQWDYGFFWNILTSSGIFGDKRTDMGHAVYREGGTDFSLEQHQLFTEPEDVFTFDMDATYGQRDIKTLIAEYDADFEKQNQLFPDCVNMTGIYVTCMSGLIDLMGWDTLLTAAGLDSQAFGDFINRYGRWIGQYFEALAQSSSPVVMIHDDIVWTSGAFLHPDFYRTYIFPNYKKLFRPLLEAGKKILFTSDGDYTMFLPDIAACGVHGFVLEPVTDLQVAVEHFGQTHAIVGNVDTRVLLHGDRPAIETEVRRCMDLGRACPGFFLAVGNHIPPNTPVEHALWYQDAYEKSCRR